MALYPDNFVGPIKPGSFRYSEQPALDPTRAAIPAGQADSPWVPTQQTTQSTQTTPVQIPTTTPSAATYNDPIKTYYQNLNTTQPTEADKQTIRENTRKEMQSTIDAINANYANLITQQNQTNQNNEGMSRAMAARSGTLGSDIGEGQIQKTKQAGQQQNKVIVDQQNAALADINDKINQRADAAIKAKQDEAKGNMEAYTQYLDKSRTESRNELTLLAQKNVDLSTLPEAQRQKLFEQAGYDSGMGELVYNAQKPKASQIDYKFEKLGDGVGLFYGVDPVTGELKQIKTKVDIPDGYSLTIAPDGTPIVFNKTTGTAQIADGVGGHPKPETPKSNIVKINGTDYQVDENGNYTNPVVPQETAKANELKNNALTAATALLEKMKNGQGTTAVGGTRLWGLGGVTSRIPGTGTSNFVNDFNNLKSLLSLDNVKYLKGQGAVSDAERELLANAASKLNLAQSDSEFKATLESLVQSLSTTGQPSQGINYSDPQVQKLKNAGFNDEEIKAALNLTDVGGDTNKAVGMRTDRHNNPAAFTTDVAKSFGLIEGKDYVPGDSFSNGKFRTAKLLGDPVATTIKGIDNGGFFTQSGNPRWVYQGSLPYNAQYTWKSLSYDQKKAVIKEMYKHEGGTQLLKYFA